MSGNRRGFVELGNFKMRRLSILGAILIAISWPASAAETTPYQFVSAYLYELGTLEDERAKGEKDIANHPGDMASCIRNFEAIGLELDAAANNLGTMKIHTGSEADVAPQYIANFLIQKREAINRLTKICAQMIQGPKAGVDYGPIAAEAPKITAKIEHLDKTMFQMAPIEFATLIDMKADSKGHANHLVISRSERDNLLKTINNYFGEKIKSANPNYAVSTADFFRTKLNEFFCSDDPWE